MIVRCDVKRLLPCLIWNIVPEGFFFYSASGINLRLKGGIKTPATPFMMRRKYSPLPVMRHKYPAKLWVLSEHKTARCCMRPRVRIQRLSHQVTEGRTALERLLLNFPREAEGTRWLRRVAQPPVRREEEIAATRVARKLSLHERAPPLGTAYSPRGGQRSVGHGRCAPFNSGVVRGGRSRLCLGALCLFFASVFKPFILFYFFFIMLSLHSFYQKPPPQSWVEHVIGQ